MSNKKYYAIVCILTYGIQAKDQTVSILEVVKKIPEHEHNNVSFVSSAMSYHSIKEIIQHMMWSSSCKVRELFTKAPLRVKHALLQRMNILEYESFLSAFSPSQWHEMLQVISDSDRTCLPSYVEQKRIIRDTWYECAPKGRGDAKDAQLRDILMWHIRALEYAMHNTVGVKKHRASLKKRMRYFYKDVHSTFQAKRVALFNNRG